MSQPFKHVSRKGKGVEMSAQRKLRLCQEWLEYCRVAGWKNDALVQLADLFWTQKGWRTFKGNTP